MKTGETKREGVYSITCFQQGMVRFLRLVDTGVAKPGMDIRNASGLAERRTGLSVVTGELLKRRGVNVAFEERDRQRRDAILCSKLEMPIQVEVTVGRKDATRCEPQIDVRIKPDAKDIPEQTIELVRELALQAYHVLSDAIFRLTLPKAPQGLWLAEARFEMGYDAKKGVVITSMMNLDTMDVMHKGKGFMKSATFTDMDALTGGLLKLLPRRQVAA